LIVCDGCGKETWRKHYLVHANELPTKIDNVFSIDVCEKCQHLTSRYIASALCNLRSFLRNVSKWTPEETEKWFQDRLKEFSKPVGE
jgi:NMD protein affecting ribosome stability and mRNA decay